MVEQSRRWRLTEIGGRFVARQQRVHLLGQCPVAGARLLDEGVSLRLGKIHRAQEHRLDAGPLVARGFCSAGGRTGDAHSGPKSRRRRSISANAP